LWLDEFAGGEPAGGTAAVDTRRAEQLYDRVFLEYGDDSVAQLGGVHLAVEGASNLLTKILEWGRLMAYLEQSTRYIPYDDRPGGRWRYHVPAELTGSLRERYSATLDAAFATYAAWLPRLRDSYTAKFPRAAGDSETAYRMTIRAKALDTLRGLLPAATTSNVGIYGTAQAYEQLLLRMRAHPLIDVLADYGAFRDLQRHRLLTLEWQRLTPAHGYVMPEPVVEAGAADDFRRVMDDAAALHDAIEAAGMPEVASYAISMAYRVRFYMEMNAREAMHLIELRSAPQGHASYRRIAQTMHRLIADRAGH